MIALLTMMTAALADPCGMVPPIWTGSGPAPVTIERQGLQQTYVFHRDGVETIAIRPGFTGSVEQFGMLIPLPAVPALRKIDDRTFDHLRSAVDPPQVRVHVMERHRLESVKSVDVPSAARMEEADELSVRRDEVRVVKEEAVGMYEVAVLEAGSSHALSRWMDHNDFRYPSGMDATVEDYVRAGWLFVAVKARVGAMVGVEPRPGMRDATHELPAGASFDGYVQGMAFRFRIDRPVVPMRLAVFNGDDTRNRVYVLAEAPVRVREVSASFVRRQVPGRTLYGNLTEPLPVTLASGRARDLDQFPQVRNARNPEPHIVAARGLMASDMLAARTHTLSLPFEEREKELLSINEALGLRGAQIDALVQQDVAEMRDRSLDPALADLYEMTLTVVDGTFPRRVLRDQNLTFDRYSMSAAANRLEVWNDRKAPLEVWVYR